MIPGVLLVGAYPASEDDEDTFELISSILKQGITKFVCLQSEVSSMNVCIVSSSSMCTVCICLCTVYIFYILCMYIVNSDI